MLREYLPVLLQILVAIGFAASALGQALQRHRRALDVHRTCLGPCTGGRIVDLGQINLPPRGIVARRTLRTPGIAKVPAGPVAADATPDVRTPVTPVLAELPPEHAHEVAEVRWLPLADAPQLLAYKGEREMAEKALDRLADEAL